MTVAIAFAGSMVGEAVITGQGYDVVTGNPRKEVRDSVETQQSKRTFVSLNKSV